MFEMHDHSRFLNVLHSEYLMDQSWDQSLISESTSIMFYKQSLFYLDFLEIAKY